MRGDKGRSATGAGEWGESSWDQRERDRGGVARVVGVAKTVKVMAENRCIIDTSGWIPNLRCRSSIASTRLSKDEPRIFR